MTVAEYLDIADKSVVAVVGCGGKTSLVELIADKLRDKKILVSTTTKILPMKADGVVLCDTLQKCREHEPQAGVQCMGVLDAASGKLKALPENILAGLIQGYDIALLEADGSRGLFCKGWKEYEPVVPDYCTHTVGIVTVSVIGRAATESCVHNLPEFLSLTKLRKGDAITAWALKAMVCEARGMFKNSVGRRYIVVNQVEDEATASIAKSFLRNIKDKYPDLFARLIYGSVHLDMWREM